MFYIKYIIIFLVTIYHFELWASGSSDVTISSGATANGSFALVGSTYVFTPSANSAVANISTIQTYLTGGNSVTILTACSGSGSQSGNVTISSAITAASAAKTFTITAEGTITVSAAINLTGSVGSNGGIITFSGATGVSVGGALTTTGGTAATISAGNNGGAITLSSSGGSVSVTAAIKSQGSAGDAGAYLAGGAGGSVSITGTSVSTSGSGTINTVGGAGRGDGGAGGVVSITSSTTSISVGATITTTGGTAGACCNSKRGGNGGNVTLDAYTSATNSSTITANGGDGTNSTCCGGNGATVTINGTSVTTGTISTTKGSSSGDGGCTNTNGSTSTCTKRTVATGSSSPTVVRNSTMTSVTHATTLVTTVGTSSGLPTGVSASYASNTITLSGTPTAVAGTYNYTITPTSSCGSQTATGTITVIEPLPVNLISFSARLKENFVEISWKTASEKNSDYFILETSNNGFDWVKLKEIKSVGNSSSISSYSWNDERGCDGICYYKLLQVDKDGKKETYKAISVSKTSLNQFDAIKLYPNPSIGGFTLEFYSPEEDELSVIIESESCKEMHNEKYKVEIGENIIHVTNESLVPGLYIVIIENSTGLEVTKKFLKE